MASLRDCQQAARKIRSELNRLLNCSGTYKTTSSWSDVKYVELTYNLFRMVDESGNFGLFTIDYDESAVEEIFRRICQQYNIDNGKSGIHMYNDRIEITLFSDEPRR